MMRKISVVVTAQPMVEKPAKEKVPSCPANFPPEQEDEIDYDLIEERESEIDGLVSEFVCDLIGADDPEEREMIDYTLQDELESLKDDFEEVLANHGIIIHRPTIIEDSNGREVMVNSLYERDC